MRYHHARVVRMDAPKNAVAGEIVDRRRQSRSTAPEGEERRGSRSDRRIAPRYKTFKGGRVVWRDGSSVECIIRNISDTGANIEVRSPVPPVFDLEFDADKARRTCRVAWYRPHRIGVRFEG